MLTSGSSPGGGRDGLEPVDVAVVVGAEEVDLLGVAAVLLGQVVGGVGGEVRGLTVCADHHAVLVIAEVGGAQPDRAAVVEHVALFAQAGDGVFDRAGVVELLLGEVDIKVDAKLGQRLLDVVHLRLVRGAPDHRQGRHFGEFADVRVLGEHLVAEVRDVLARVAALGHVPAVQPGEHGVREHVHLGAGVVDVVLGRDVGTGGPEDAGDRVAEGGPAGVADVQRAGGVGRDELHVDHVPGERGVGAVGGTGLDDRLGEGTGGSGVHGDVQEAGAGDVHRGHAVDRFEPGAQDGRELPRVGARRLGQLEGDVGGPVPVVPVLRALHAHLIRDVGCGKGYVTGRDGVLQAGGYGEGEFFWGHTSSLPVGPWCGGIWRPA